MASRPQTLLYEFNWGENKQHTEFINWLNTIQELSNKENEQATEIDVRVDNCHS